MCATAAVEETAVKTKKRGGSMRVAKMPVLIKSGVTVTVDKETVTVKGKRESLALTLPRSVRVEIEGDSLWVRLNPGHEGENAIAATMRAHLNNFVKGLTEGFNEKLVLVGVGYKAEVEGQNLSLTLGHSHRIVYPFPETVRCQVSPSKTEIFLESANKQLLGQVCAEIIKFRPTEPYKGKGVKKSTTVVVLKETKKKK